MLPYVLMFAFFALGALLSRAETRTALAGGGAFPGGAAPRRVAPMLVVGGILIALLIGLRFEVGADWRAYEAYWKRAAFLTFDQIIGLTDPAYHMVNWLAQRLGLGVWAVNLACGGLFAWGLVRFASSQPRPWLVIVVAIPYLVTVVAMGYTRQAVAIGFLLAGLASVFQGGSLGRFLLYALIAALFHRTSILVLPLVIFALERSRFLSIVAGLVFIVALYTALLADDVDAFVKNYIQARYSSEGALVRVALSVIPALIFFSLRQRLGFDRMQDRFWQLSSLAALALLAAFLVVPSSTAIDRMALYLFPLQLAVLARLPMAFSGQVTTLAVILYSLLIQLVWLNFAVHARWWVPYHFIPL
jgi:hypothetical protein